MLKLTTTTKRTSLLDMNLMTVEPMRQDTLAHSSHIFNQSKFKFLNLPQILLFKIL